MTAVRTRDRILDAGRQLFNHDGLAGVTTHRIATELGVSQGNLHYHFRTREAIVTALFRRFESRLSACIESHADADALDDWWLTLHLTYEVIDEYQFVYRDVAYLLTEYPALESDLQALTARQLVATRNQMQRLRSAAVLRMNEEDAEMLALQLVFSMTCWTTFKRMMPKRPKGHSDAALATYYTLTLLSPFVSEPSRPYLDYLRHKYVS